MSRWRLGALLALALVAAPALAAGPDFAALQIEPYEPPKPTPVFALPDLDGKVRSLADLRGKVVLLVFWATWWPDCREELPPINRLYTELKFRDFEVLLVNFREDPAHVKRVAQERRYVAPVLLDRSGDTTGRLYGVFGPPTFYLIDRQGRLVGRAVGPRDWSAPTARRLLLGLPEGKP